MNKFTKNKKGIEPVIATVLLIVITIAVIGIVVAFLFPYIQNLLDQQTACKSISLKIDESGLSCTEAIQTKIMVEANFGSESNLSKIVSYALLGGSTNTNVSITNLPESGGARTYIIPSSGIKATRVWVIPTMTYKNKQFECAGAKAELTPVPDCSNY